ncbi:MAG TPA: HAD hydrolase-like protein, partial [Vicinamibacterales bacterium]
MTSRLNVKALVFDLDGTLVDSRRDLASSANELLRDCGGQGLDEEAVGRMVGEGAAVLVHRVFSAAGIPEPPDALARFLDI